MKHDITDVLRRHIADLSVILARYEVADKESLVSAAAADMVFEKAILMTVGYIGELSKKLDDGIISANPQINWRRLGRSRNIIFHDYDIVDMEIIASVIFKDIELLKTLL
jgi:uncharacterized protein with HEPN domain